MTTFQWSGFSFCCENHKESFIDEMTAVESDCSFEWYAQEANKNGKCAYAYYCKNDLPIEGEASK
jgi:hypothetical protein